MGATKKLYRQVHQEPLIRTKLPNTGTPGREYEQALAKVNEQAQAAKMARQFRNLRS